MRYIEIYIEIFELLLKFAEVIDLSEFNMDLCTHPRAHFTRLQLYFHYEYLIFILF